MRNVHPRQSRTPMSVCNVPVPGTTTVGNGVGGDVVFVF